jgi:signal transduction histidine kinase
MSGLKPSSRLEFSFEIAISILVLIVVCFYNYVFLFGEPYIGFNFSSLPTRIVTVFSQPASGESLQPGDYLVKVGSIDWAENRKNIQEPSFSIYKTGEPITLVVERNGQQIPITWILPGINLNEFLYRVTNAWWLAFIFWMAGFATLFLVRPKDIRSRLLATYNFLIAIWVASGFVSSYHTSLSAVVVVITSWIMIPVSWQLHWNFPVSLGRLPKYSWGLLYLATIGLVMLAWSKNIPQHDYPLAMILSVAGGLLLLIAQAVFQPGQRRQIGVLLTGVVIACAPGMLLSILRLFDLDSKTLIQVSIFSLILLPVAYFYVIYRRQLGGLELRASRFLSLLIYVILLLSASAAIATVVDALIPAPHATILAGTLLAVLAGFFTALAYPHYERWIERQILGMPLPPNQLVEAYTARITTSLEMDRLVRLIRDEVLPSLLIRQAALMRLEESSSPNEHPVITRIFTLGIQDSQLPRPEAIPLLLAEAGKVRQDQPDNDHAPLYPWVRLVMTLSVEGHPVGLFLLGRRDPDDTYSISEIPTLQALADQTALALSNIEQAERLHALYQADIERQEAERSRLAFELHDGVLGQLALLSMHMDKSSSSEQFSVAYQATVQRIRDIIIGLRPAMLDFSLPSALTELVDEASDQIIGGTRIELDLLPSESRYPLEVELHLFRIIQQACQNAIQHAEAQRICLHGRFQSEKVEVMVEDDGKGFADGNDPDLTRLLANRHFGLATMHERAALIGAYLHITSIPGRGTQVRLVWEKNGRHYPTGGN